MTFSQLTVKSDLIGIFASGLCLVHCIATPFLFIANTNLGIQHGTRPEWWGYLDPLFLGLSFFAVYWSVKNTNKSWIKYSFWALWSLLFLIVINEKMGLFHILEEAIYIPSLGLVGLHFYNRRFHHLHDDHCCLDG